MRKFIAIFSAFLLFAFTAISALAQQRIDSFNSNIRINKDGSINVIETIDYDFGSTARHGIFRDIPHVKTNSEGKKFELEYQILSVTDGQNSAYKYTTTSRDSDLEIKIGDPDLTVTGEHRYVIEYRVIGALTYFSDHDELYWNVTGNSWNVDIDEVVAEVSLPEKLTEGVNLACYTGPVGSSSSDCVFENVRGVASFRSNKALLSGEGLTMVVGFPKNLVAVVEPKEYITFWETWYGNILKILIFSTIIILSVLWYIVYPIWIVVKWYKYGRDPKVPEGPVSAWFDPPKTLSGRDLTPAETGTLIDEHAQQKDISALIVDLAMRGFLKIEERKKKDFYLVKKVKKLSELLPFENTIISDVFKDNNEVRLKDEHLFTTVEKVKKELYENLVKEKFFPKNPSSTRNFYSVMTVLSVTTLNLPLFVTSLIFGRAMPAKTILGARSANIAKSLRNFLSSQERQLEYQAKNQLMFEKLLPYAVAFGVEKLWAQRFKDIVLKEPEWYSTYSGGRFNSVIFANSLDSSFKSFSSAATPTSSSSGFSSGFSGGSSGGGGGGGGGGSW